MVVVAVVFAVVGLLVGLVALSMVCLSFIFVSLHRITAVFSLQIIQRMAQSHGKFLHKKVLCKEIMVADLSVFDEIPLATTLPFEERQYLRSVGVM